jgi:predicted amidohydrolase YtcJ
MSLLLTDVTVGDRPGRAVAVADGRITWLGDAREAPAADRVIAGEGALLTPAFVDGHVHATATGLALAGLDLHGSSSLAAAVAAAATTPSGRRASCSAPAGTRPAGPTAAA